MGTGHEVAERIVAKAEWTPGIRRFEKLETGAVIVDWDPVSKREALVLCFWAGRACSWVVWRLNIKTGNCDIGHYYESLRHASEGYDKRLAEIRSALRDLNTANQEELEAASEIYDKFMGGA